MINTMLKFIGVNKWLLLGGAAVALSSAACAWQVQGWRYGLQIAEIENTQWQTEIKRQLKVVEAQRYQNQLKDLVSQNRQLAEQKQKTVTEYVTKEVTKYVQSPDAGKCHFTDDWVRIYNTAASNDISNTATGANAGSERTENADTASDRH